MSRAVPTDFEFNKELFADLLKKAKQDLPLNTFAKKCGISVSYLCKYLRGRLDNAPTPNTLKKISAYTEQYGVTFEDLLTAAGYTASKYLDIPPIESKTISLEKLAIATITTGLMNLPFKWSVCQPQNPELYDLDIEFNKDCLNHWFFDFRSCFLPFRLNMLNAHRSRRPFSENDLSNLSNNIFYHLGKLTSTQCTENMKFSFVTNSEIMFDELASVNPYMVSMYISVILIDTENIEIKKEKYLNSSLPLTSEISSTFTFK